MGLKSQEHPRLDTEVFRVLQLINRLFTGNELSLLKLTKAHKLQIRRIHNLRVPHEQTIQRNVHIKFRRSSNKDLHLHAYPPKIKT
jgi:hypothetical protein